MRKKIALYILFVLLFLIGKWIFMMYHHDIYGVYSGGDWMAVLWHGLPHDLACAGYLMAIPFLVQFVFIWTQGSWHAAFMRFWIRLCLALILINFVSDLFLYEYWGFRIDGTALFYLLDDPVAALGQSPVWMWFLLPLFVAVWWVMQYLFNKLYPLRSSRSGSRLPTFRMTKIYMVVNLVLCGLLFLGIRGGVTPATLNVGRVYFSSEMPLNQAATNPFFSFFYSVTHGQKDYAHQYRFMSDGEAAAAYAELNTPSVPVCVEDSVTEDELSVPVVLDSMALLADSLSHLPWLTTDRPNIVLLILESFSGAACQGVTASADSAILPNVNRMYREGIGFRNFFANSFRTDRGCAAILSSYPGQPTNSVMKDQSKCNNLQHLGKRLKENGYNLHFVHGGDVNFTNMRGFLISGGFEHITGDSDFPVSDRLSKWGVPDHKMFRYLYDEIIQETSEPYFKVMLSLSSHEPFDVEYRHFSNPYINSIAYADSCIGSFIDSLRQTPAWDNLLIIGLADHSYGNYPDGLQNHEVLRYRIPMFWTGGAVSRPRLVDTYGSQTDLSATLLGQMGITHDDFVFSKDMNDSTIGHYAFYSFSDGFGLVTDSCRYIQDNARSGQGLSGTDDPKGNAERWGKAYLQILYDDLSRR